MPVILTSRHPSIFIASSVSTTLSRLCPSPPSKSSRGLCSPELEGEHFSLSEGHFNFYLSDHSSETSEDSGHRALGHPGRDPCVSPAAEDLREEAVVRAPGGQREAEEGERLGHNEEDETHNRLPT